MLRSPDTKEIILVGIDLRAGHGEKDVKHPSLGASGFGPEVRVCKLEGLGVGQGRPTHHALKALSMS